MKKTKQDRSPLAGLIVHCQRERGMKSEVLRRVEAALGRTVTWAQVSGWLHPNAARRVKPSLETGMALLGVWHQLQWEKMKGLQHDTGNPNPK